MADIVIRGVGIPKQNEGPYIMWVYPDGKTVVYSYVVNGDEFGPDSQKVIETTAAPLPEGHGRLGDVVRPRWIEIDDYVLCSNCGVAEHSPNRNYCHSCGANMRKAVEIRQVK